MAIKTIFQWQNNDSTADLNKRFSTVFHKGVTTGGAIVPILGTTNIFINPFEAIAKDGLMVVSDSDYLIENIPLNQATVVCFLAKWQSGDNPIAEFKTYEINNFNNLSNKEDHIVLGTVTLSTGETSVDYNNISYVLKDTIDKLGRSSFRGHIDNVSQLPATKNLNGDVYVVGISGGILELYAWNTSAWLNVTNTLTLQNQLTNHRNNAYTNEKHLTDDEKDALIGTVGIPSGSNRLVTNQDTRIPTQDENDALTGSHGSPSIGNKYVTELYPVAEVNYLVYPLAPGTLSLISVGKVYVGNQGIDTANKYFTLMEIGSERGYINTSGLFPRVNGVYINPSLSQKINPSVDADADGYYSGDLYITVDQVIDTGVRLAYGMQRNLENLDSGFSIRKGPSSDYVSGEAVQFIQNIKGRNYTDLIPEDETNYQLRNDLDGLISYLGSNQKISSTASLEDFNYFSTDTKLSPYFSKNENYVPTYTFSNTGLLNFSYSVNTGNITYSGSPDLTNVKVGNLFVDGVGNKYKVTAKTTNTLSIVDPYTNIRPTVSPISTVANPSDGGVIVNNNPRNILTNELKVHAQEVIKFDKLVDIFDSSFPEGREAFGVSQENKRVNPRVILYGGWENYTDADTEEAYVKNTSGIGDIQITDYFSSVYLLCKPKPNSPDLSVSVNNEQILSTVSTSFANKANATVGSEAGVRYTKVLISSGHDSSKLTTINMRIASAGLDPLVVYGLEVVANALTSSTGLSVEAGVGFKSAKTIKKSTNEAITIAPVNKYGVNYQVVLDRDSSNLPVTNVISTPMPELDYYPSHPVTNAVLGSVLTINDANAKIFNVGDLVYLIGTVTEVSRITAISGNNYTVSPAPTPEVKSVRLLCSLADDTPYDGYNDFAAKYNIVTDFKNGSKKDFSLTNSGSMGTRHAVHSDGQTILSAVNGNVSEDNKNLTISIAPSLGSLTINSFGPKIALDFDNANPVTVNISVDGSPSYAITIPAGKIRKTIYTKARNSSHVAVISPTTAPFTVTNLLIYSIARGNVGSSIPLACIDNVSPYTAFTLPSTSLCDPSSGKVYYDMITHSQVVDSVTPNTTVNYNSSTGYKYLTIGSGTQVKFSFVGEAFEIYGGTALIAPTVTVNGSPVTPVLATATGNTSYAVYRVTGLTYGENNVTITTASSISLYGYAVLSINGYLRNTYNPENQIYSSVYDTRVFASASNTQISSATIASTGTVTGTTFNVNQTAHGFSALTPIYHDGTIWRKAIANDSAMLATYVVTKASTDSFTAAKFGVFTITGHGLTVGEFYYVDSITAGALTTTEPMFGFSNPVLYVESSTRVHIMVYRPAAIGDGSVSDSEIGAIMAFPSNAEPPGFLYCDGRAVSRTTYPELFLKCGTAYGAGDGATTFNLPDFRGMFLRGGTNTTNINFATTAVTIGTDTINIPDHKIVHSGLKIRFTSTGTLPTGLSTGVTYYAIYVNDSNIKVATTLANALAGVAIDLTSVGSGTHTLVQYMDPDSANRTAFVSSSGLSGNNFGTYQDSMYGSHTHIQDAHSHPIPYNLQTFSVNNNISHVGAGSEGYINSPSTSSTTATNQNSGGNETRPQNITVAYFIRYAPKGAIKGQEIPAGLIFPFGGTNASIPSGYLLCDGSSLSRSTYTKLFNTIGTAFGSLDASSFNLPDLRGRFLRGVDGTAGNDPDKASRTAMNTGGNTGNNVGSIQGDQFGSHNHGGGAHSHSYYYNNGGSTYGAGFSASGANPSSSNLYSASTSNSGAIIASNGGNETRPKNAYVNYIIKI